MGKKSRRRNLKSAKNGLGDITLNNITSNLSASSFSPPSFAADLPQPAEGWARELRKLEKELQNTHYQDAEIVMSTAKVARVMRQFDVLEKILTKAENKGVVIEDQEMWSRLNEDVAALKRVKTTLGSDNMKKIIHDVMKEGVSVNELFFDSSTFLGLNCLQDAASRGDVQLLEQLIKMGAALDVDYPASACATQSGPVMKPKMCTALLMAVNGALINRYGMSTIGAKEVEARRDYEGCVECAIQLVRLGADTSVTFQFPPGGKNHPIYKSWHIWNIEGKSVREVAAMVGSDLFEKTVEEFSTMEHQIEHVNCRCGSRLPWKQCHAGKPTDRYYLHYKADKKNISKITWRHSPLAPCQCNATNALLGRAGTKKKIYFKCCWDETGHIEYYQNDKTSEINGSTRREAMNFMQDVQEMMKGNYKNDKWKTSEINAPMHFEVLKNMQEIMKGISEDEIPEFVECVQQICSKPELITMCRSMAVREGGAPAMRAFVAGDHPCSKLSSWDPEVFAGVMEIMDPKLSFQWNDVHWALPKAELLYRVSEWNEALEQYCDSIGLSGSKREAVIKLHTASPFAPCGNVKCGKMETKVKQFPKCSKCSSVAYCSSACQREDWKNHKQTYCKAGTRERQSNENPSGESLRQMLTKLNMKFDV